MRLEPLAESRLDAVGALLDDPDVLRFTRIPEPPPAASGQHANICSCIQRRLILRLCS